MVKLSKFDFIDKKLDYIIQRDGMTLYDAQIKDANDGISAYLDFNIEIIILVIGIFFGILGSLVVNNIDSVFPSFTEYNQFVFGTWFLIFMLVLFCGYIIFTKKEIRLLEEKRESYRAQAISTLRTLQPLAEEIDNYNKQKKH